MPKRHTIFCVTDFYCHAMKPNYAIFRVEKVKTVGDLKRLAAHTERSGSEVANASKPYKAVPVVGNSNLVKGVTDSLPPKYRKDAVLALEFVLTASRGAFCTELGVWDYEKIDRFEKTARGFLEREFGLCVHARFHLDEETPHFQGFIVPNSGFFPGANLTAKTLFNPGTLAGYQTKWYAFMIENGFDVIRGVEGSQAEHENIHDYYARVEKPLPNLPPVPAPVPTASTADKLKEAAGFETPHSIAVKQRNDAIYDLQIISEEQRRSAIIKVRELEAENLRLKNRAEKAEAKNLKLKEQTSKLRTMPLVEVLQFFGATENKSEKGRWDTEAGAIWIEKKDGDRFNSFHPETAHLKGRGAIDLVIKIKGVGFDEAVGQLARAFDGERVGGAVASRAMHKADAVVQKALESPAKAVELPTPSLSSAGRVRAYLVDARGIPGRLVDRLAKVGRIFADHFSNAVFKTDKGDGAELRGTGNGSSWKGHRGLKSGFTVPGRPNYVAIVESAVEALSVHALFGYTAVSTGGTNPNKAIELAKQHTAYGVTVYAGQNADRSGDLQARAIMDAVPGVERLRPQSHNDWNDVLRAKPPEFKTEWDMLNAPETSADRLMKTALKKPSNG